MTKRIFAGRVVALFCCLAGLAWAGHGLLDLQPGVAVVSKDVLMKNVWVGKMGFWKCDVSLSCPAPCVPGSHIGEHISGNPYIPYNWFGYVPGTRGCSVNTEYKICGDKLCLSWCDDNAKKKCGVVVIPTESIMEQKVNGKIKRILLHHCKKTTTVCLNGCG